ncbi:MAG: hypothetical protein U0X86_001091 [Wolbachia endosymbiont of Xenopsylla cheopis]
MSERNKTTDTTKPTPTLRRKQSSNPSSKPNTEITIEINNKSAEIEREPTNFQERKKRLRENGLVRQ